MKFDELFDNYPIPFFVIEPIYNEKEEMINFKYRYLNESFARFLGKSKNEIYLNDFISMYGENYEKDWMNFFNKIIETKGFISETRFTSIIKRTIVIESFYIKPNLIANFIKDFYSPKNELDEKNKPNIDILRKANYDYMTNFYNENYLKENLKLIEQSQKIGFVFLDINNLTKINNEKGHKAGDELILDFVNEVRSNFVGNDYFRLGGDEFLVIVIGLTENKFNELCLNVQKKFDEMDLASLGFKFYESIVDLYECIKEAEQDMLSHRKQVRRLNVKK